MLLPKVAFWSEKMGLTPAGVKITAARTRYGSCSGRNRSWNEKHAPANSGTRKSS